jgi:hypothetical protein
METRDLYIFTTGVTFIGIITPALWNTALAVFGIKNRNLANNAITAFIGRIPRACAVLAGGAVNPVGGEEQHEPEGSDLGEPPGMSIFQSDQNCG